MQDGQISPLVGVEIIEQTPDGKAAHGSRPESRLRPREDLNADLNEAAAIIKKLPAARQ